MNRQIRIAQHPDGPVFADLGGDPSNTINMRSYSKSTAAQQRARNTGLHPMVTSNRAASFASADSTLSTSSSTPNQPTIIQTPQRIENGRKRVKKRIYNALSVKSPSQLPSPATTEAMAVVLQTMAEEKRSAVTTRIEDAVEEGMDVGGSQDIMTQCVVMQKALLQRNRD